jgi:prolyl-tRNA synthetase
MRGREFLMKDLYTFDVNNEQALSTYKQVTDAYARIFTRIGLANHYCAARADTGFCFRIGGRRRCCVDDVL